MDAYNLSMPTIEKLVGVHFSLKIVFIFPLYM